MSLLTDIAIKHVYTGKKSPAPLTFTMHPFENSVGEHAGRFEVIRSFEKDGKEQKRSAHLTKAELAELYGRNLHEQFGIRLRIRPTGDNYPGPHPGKRIPSACITPGSDFDRMVRRIDSSQAISTGLREQIRRIGL